MKTNVNNIEPKFTNFLSAYHSGETIEFNNTKRTGGEWVKGKLVGLEGMEEKCKIKYNGKCHWQSFKMRAAGNTESINSIRFIK